MSRTSRYTNSQKVSFTPFIYFVNIVQEITKMLNDPSFHQPPQPVHVQNKKSFYTTPARQTVIAKKTDVNFESECPIHKTNHFLNARLSRQNQFKCGENSLVTIRYAMEVVTPTSIWNMHVNNKWTVEISVVRKIQWSCTRRGKRFTTSDLARWGETQLWLYSKGFSNNQLHRDLWEFLILLEITC